MRGRVMALYSIVFLGSTPIGAPLVGWLAEVGGAARRAARRRGRGADRRVAAWVRSRGRAIEPMRASAPRGRIRAPRRLAAYARDRVS